MYLISFHEKYLQNFKYNHGVSQEEKIFYILHKLGNKTQLRSKCTVNPLMRSVASGESGGGVLKLVLFIFLIQGSCVQNHWVALRLTQPFILPRLIKWVPGISGNLVVKSTLSLWSGTSLEAVETHP